jgi:hypothetical protein
MQVITDRFNYSIRTLNALGQVQTLIGHLGQGFKDGSLAEARLNTPLAKVWTTITKAFVRQSSG